MSFHDDVKKFDDKLNEHPHISTLLIDWNLDYRITIYYHPSGNRVCEYEHGKERVAVLSEKDLKIIGTEINKALAGLNIWCSKCYLYKSNKPTYYLKKKK